MTSRPLFSTLIASLAIGLASMSGPALAAEVADARGESRVPSAPVSGVIRTSDAERLFRGQVPSIKNLDGHYDNLRGLNAQRRAVRIQCRTSWAKMRAKRVEPRPIRANLNTIYANARRANLALGKVNRALKTFLKNQDALPNQDFVSIIDFDKPTKAKRLFSIDLRTGQIEAFHVAAGRGSDPFGTGYATRFGDVAGSNASSLGCSVGFGTYPGKFRRESLILHGIDKSNGNTCDREIVMHEAPYVGKGAGRSEGCPAVKHHDREKIFERVNNGGLLCAYRDGASEVAVGRPPRRRHAHHHRGHVRHARRTHAHY